MYKIKYWCFTCCVITALLRIYFDFVFCVGLSGGVVVLELVAEVADSGLIVRRGTFFKLVCSFLSGRGDMLVDSTFCAATSEVCVNQTPRESECRLTR